LRAAEFDCAVDERATSIVGIAKPFGQRKNDGLEQILPICGRALQRPLEPCKPFLVPILEKGSHQVVLAWEVPIKGHFGDPGLLDDAIHPGCAYAFPVKQIMRSQKNALTCGQSCRGWFFLLHCYLPCRQTCPHLLSSAM